MTISSNQTLKEIRSCCQQKVDSSCCQKVKPSPLLKQVDTICRIAIGAFAFLIAPWPFVISFTAGFIGGTVYMHSEYWQAKLQLSDGEDKPVCAQGYMDFLSGMRFPPIAGTLATAAFIAAHMRHDPRFYVPFCGLFFGFWAGKEMAVLCKPPSCFL